MMIDTETQVRVEEAAALLIQAAEVLSTLDEAQLEALERATCGNLPGCLAFVLRGARAASPAVDARLRDGHRINLPGVSF